MVKFNFISIYLLTECRCQDINYFLLYLTFTALKQDFKKRLTV